MSTNKSFEPLVSVVIPTFNHAHLVVNALRSLCNQTYKNWEAIIVNNYSSDNTIEVIQGFSDNRIKLINFRNNGIIAASRNIGIAESTGDYIAFLDSDDTWYPDKLRKCMNHFDVNIDLVCHGLMHINGSFVKEVFCGPESKATSSSLIFEGSCITPSATIVRKSFVNEVNGFSEDERFVTAEDYHFFIKLSILKIKMYFINEILGDYYVHSGSQSSAVMRHLHANLDVINEFAPLKGNRNIRYWLLIRRRHCISYYWACRVMQRNNDYSGSLRLVIKSIFKWPFYVKSYYIFFNYFARLNF